MKTILRSTYVFLLFSSFLFVQCKKEDTTPVIPKSSNKTLDNPTVDGITGASSTYDAATSSYTVTVPGGTDLSAIKFTFTVPTGATAKPASGSVQNFTNPVSYTITAEDGSTQLFTVKVLYKSTWASSQERYDAIRIKAQRVSGATVSSAIPGGFSNNGTITDADVAYIVNTADFLKAYSDTKTTGWQAIDKAKLEFYYISLDNTTGQLRVDKGTNVTLDANGNLTSYKPYWALFYSK